MAELFKDHWAATWAHVEVTTTERVDKVSKKLDQLGDRADRVASRLERLATLGFDADKLGIDTSKPSNFTATRTISKGKAGKHCQSQTKHAC